MQHQNNLLRGFLAFSFLSIVVALSGQQDKCSDILSGLIDYKSQTFDREFFRRYYYEMDEKKFRSNNSYKEHNEKLGVTVPIYNVPVTFEYGSDGKIRRNNEAYDSFSEMISDDIRFKESFEQLFKSANATVVKEWGLCMSQKRFISWLEFNDEFIHLYMQRGKSSNPPVLRITELEYSENLELEGYSEKTWWGRERMSTDYRGRKIGGSPIRITFRATDRKKASYITVTTDDSDFTVQHDVRAIIPDPKPNVKKAVAIDLCTCQTHGSKLRGMKFWGPKGYPCGGIASWGVYKNDCRKVTVIGKATGAGGLSGITFWGPIGERVAGIADWPKYGGNPVKITASSGQIGTMLRWCSGYGGLSNVTFWGPQNEPCCGLSQWHTFRFGNL